VNCWKSGVSTWVGLRERVAGLDTVLGQCKLCGNHSELQESHVWPKFAYKRYAADQSKGGSFVDLGKGRVTNKQYKFYWLCRYCEGVLSKLEDYAADFCARLEWKKAEPHAYDSRLLRFLTSINWRTGLAMMEWAPDQESVELTSACVSWRAFLKGKRPNVRPYSQHLFVFFSPGEIKWHEGIGGAFFSDDHVVVSQVGPLRTAGLTERKHLSAIDRKAWDTSEIKPEGGEVTPIEVWIGNKNITVDFAKLLKFMERDSLARVRKLDIDVD
jgi:hypothetical protein